MTNQEKLQALLILDGIRTQMGRIEDTVALVEMGEEDGLDHLVSQTKYSLVQMSSGLDEIERLAGLRR